MNNRIYSEEEDSSVIRERYLETIKNFLRNKLDEVPEKERLDILISDDATFRVVADFEIYYRIIFGSQIGLLITLYKSNRYFSKMEIEDFFNNEMQKRKVELDVKFDNWLNFLLDQELVSKKDVNSLSEALSGGGYRITDKGVVFLTYISGRNYDNKTWGI